MPKIIVITGPTGVGKTKLSISIAKKYNGEIINADAMQIYKGLDIGTAKITEQEKEGIPHHLFDIKEVGEEYSIYNYQKDARKCIDDIINRGKTPILVGGTGLYIKACLYDYKLTPNTPNNKYDNYNKEELYNILKNIDPLSASKIDKNNKRRLISAINYYQTNNKSIINNKTNKILYPTLFIALTTDRKTLYNIINNRVDKMLKMGLKKEVEEYYKKGIIAKPLLSGIGYKELYAYFNKKIDYKTAIENIKKNSRHYAKRQYTYLNHQLPIKYFESDYQNFNNTIEEVIEYINKNR